MQAKDNPVIASLIPFPPRLCDTTSYSFLNAFVNGVPPLHLGHGCCFGSDVSSSALQKTLDYACGAGADCNPIHQNGPCFNPNTVQAHCSYAVNSYFQRKGQTQQACDFSSTASLSQNDPSSSGCTYPATPSAAGISGSTPSTASSGTGSLNSNSPTTTGSFPNNLGPSGSDSSNAGLLIPSANMMALLISCLVLLVIKG